MSVSEKVVPFHVFQNHCDDRHFSYMGVSGKFFVTCKKGYDKCNFRVCPIWNSDQVQGVQDFLRNEQDQEQILEEEDLGMSLHDVNMRLRHNEAMLSVDDS